jgi:hypothetical protein
MYLYFRKRSLYQQIIHAGATLLIVIQVMLIRITAIAALIAARNDQKRGLDYRTVKLPDTLRSPMKDGRLI